MTNINNVLIVEDEPLMIDVIQRALSQISESNGLMSFNIRTALNCDQARDKIQKAVTGKHIDLVLLDINIPPSSDRNLLCGEDVGLQIREFFPKAKIMAFTSHRSNYRLYNILKSINPEGFLIKNEIDFPKLIRSISAILSGEPFYSRAILQLMRLQMGNDFVLDKTERQLLYQISKGGTIKEISEVLSLSISSIEYRKRHLNELFEVTGGDDRMLIKQAEQHGFI